MTDVSPPADGVTESKPDLSHQSQAAPSWYLDDNTPGQGNRPDWLPDKYLKASDLGKSYKELESRLGGFTGAPEKYDVASLELDENDPLIINLMNTAKEQNMSQAAFNKLIGTIVTTGEARDEHNLEEQCKKLGPDAQRELVAFKNWTKDYFQPAEREVATQWVKTADDLKVFNKMMANSHMSQVPTAQNVALANSYETVQDLGKEMTKNISRYESDAAYRKDYARRLDNAVKRQGG